jgi:hypothetical protein
MTNPNTVPLLMSSSRCAAQGLIESAIVATQRGIYGHSDDIHHASCHTAVLLACIGRVFVAVACSAV